MTGRWFREGANDLIASTGERGIITSASNNRGRRNARALGATASLALPLFEAMLPSRVLGAAVPAKAPRRMAFLYVPNGIHMQAWTPAAEGAGYELPPILHALRPFKDDMLVLSGLTCDKARPNGDGATARGHPR